MSAALAAPALPDLTDASHWAVEVISVTPSPNGRRAVAGHVVAFCTAEIGGMFTLHDMRVVLTSYGLRVRLPNRPIIIGGELALLPSGKPSRAEVVTFRSYPAWLAFGQAVIAAIRHAYPDALPLPSIHFPPERNSCDAPHERLESQTKSVA
jgi:hypothetical protein